MFNVKFICYCGTIVYLTVKRTTEIIKGKLLMCPEGGVKIIKQRIEHAKKI